MSGHSVSAAHEKTVVPLTASGAASQNGHRRRARDVIAENAPDSTESSRSARRTSPAGPAADNRDGDKPAPTGPALTPNVRERTLGSTDSRSSGMLGSDGRDDSGVEDGAERAVLLATKLHVPWEGQST